MPILGRETCIHPDSLLDDFAMWQGDDERRWWAVYTRSRAEKALARQLSASETPFYLPLVAKQQFISGRRVRSFLPLFSGYLFLYGSEEERVQMLSGSQSRVSRVLRVQDELQLVDDLRQVKHLIQSEAPLTIESRLAPGQRVRVRKGALQGLEGVIIRRQNSDRLVVAVNYLQQGVSVEIDDFMVEPI